MSDPAEAAHRAVRNAVVHPRGVPTAPPQNGEDMLSQTEIQRAAYIATNNEYVYEGWTEAQWREIASEQGDAEAWRIADVLETLNTDATTGDEGDDDA